MGIPIHMLFYFWDTENKTTFPTGAYYRNFFWYIFIGILYANFNKANKVYRRMLRYLYCPDNRTLQFGGNNMLIIRGQSAALGQRMPWANRLFSKSIKGKILNFLHEVEKMISVISPQVWSKILDFPSLKKNIFFKRQN